MIVFIFMMILMIIFMIIFRCPALADAIKKTLHHPLP